MYSHSINCLGKANGTIHSSIVELGDTLKENCLLRQESQNIMRHATDSWSGRVQCVEKGQEESWLHFIHQTLVNPHEEPRNFMDATVSESLVSHREASSPGCSYHQLMILFSPSLHRLWDHKPIRQVLVSTGGSVVAQQHQLLGFPLQPCGLLMKTRLLSLTTEIRSLEFP